MKVTWAPREPPLVPRAFAARGAAARTLARRLAELAADVTVVAGSDVLVAVATGAPLPPLWVDGIVYLGRDDRAPTLLVPTALAPSVPIALLESALHARFPGVPAPLALWPRAGGVDVLPVGHARSAPPAALAAFAGP